MKRRHHPAFAMLKRKRDFKISMWKDLPSPAVHCSGTRRTVPHRGVCCQCRGLQLGAAALPLPAAGGMPQSGQAGGVHRCPDVPQAGGCHLESPKPQASKRSSLPSKPSANTSFLCLDFPTARPKHCLVSPRAEAHKRLVA